MKNIGTPQISILNTNQGASQGCTTAMVFMFLKNQSQQKTKSKRAQPKWTHFLFLAI